MDNNGFYIQSIDIQLDLSVKSISKVAAMCLSGSIANGIALAQNENPNIKIFKNKIEFGKCYNYELQGITGNVFPNFYMEFGNLIYYYDDSFKCSLWDKQLDYKGFFAPTEPDNIYIFNLIYPRFN